MDQVEISLPQFCSTFVTWISSITVVWLYGQAVGLACKSPSKAEKMKWTAFLILLLLNSCDQKEKDLSASDIAQIKNDIISKSEKHASDLENHALKSVLDFYGNTEDFAIFGDGYYWGDYQTAVGVLNKMIGPDGWKKILKWDLQNHKVNVLSENAASYLVEFDHEHIEKTGDTARSSGCFTYGMQKISGDWRAVTVHVSHIPFRTTDEKWWSEHAPENRKKK